MLIALVLVFVSAFFGERGTWLRDMHEFFAVIFGILFLCHLYLNRSWVKSLIY